MIKKGVILTLLTSFVFLMNFQISYADDVKIVREIDGLSVTEDGSYKVKYNETKPILLKQNDYVKLNIKKDKEVVILLDGSEIETPPGKLPQSPFKYALFAGAEEINGNKDVLILRGDQLSISGYSHSNGNIIGGIGPGSAVCRSDEDLMASVGEVLLSGDKLKVNKEEGVSIIPMPDLSEKFAVDAKTSKSYFSTAFNPKTGEEYYKDIIVSSGEGVTGIIKSEFGSGLTCTYTGDTWQIIGDHLVLSMERPLFFDGNVEFSLNNVSGDGFIIATGNILFNTGGEEKGVNLGLAFKDDGTVDLENSTEIGFYSIAGNIDFNMLPVVRFKGIVYAPGRIVENEKGELVRIGGKVQMSTDYFELYGSLVASTLELYGNKKIYYVENDLSDELEDDTTSRIDFSNVQSVALKIANELSKGKNNVNMATIIYSDTADILGKGFYKLNNEDELNELSELIKEYEIREGSNLGDGLRLAYHTLKEGAAKDGDDTLNEPEKFLIVLTYNEPTRYTDVDISYTGEIPSGDIRIKECNIEEALNYAERVAEVIKEERFDNIYFIDLDADGTLNSVKEVLKKAGTKEEFTYDPKAVVEGTAKQTFEEALDISIQSILKDINYIPIVEKVEVAFNDDKSHVLPDYVEFVKTVKEQIEIDGEKKIVEKKSDFYYDEYTRELELIEDIIIDLSSDKTEAKIEDLIMFVKFNTVTNSEQLPEDYIEFKETELIYTITLVDRNGKELKEFIHVPVDKMRVRVESKIDIN
ncbi:VWA domain-containing protein [Acetivibrio clariflavus]|uniref:VWA domain-containing protein n=1 Tax=Acetivibrio clariflavus TaxID=288965 RepID=UPI0031F48CBA